MGALLYESTEKWLQGIESFFSDVRTYQINSCGSRVFGEVLVESFVKIARDESHSKEP